MKQESEVRIDEREEQKKEEFGKRKEIVVAVQSQKDNAMKEMERVKEDNKKIRDEVNKELTEAAQRKKDEMEIEQRKKEELIR